MEGNNRYDSQAWHDWSQVRLLGGFPILEHLANPDERHSKIASTFLVWGWKQLLTHGQSS